MSSQTAWVFLVIAGLLEVVWSIGLKFTEGFTKLAPSIGTVAAMAISMYLLSKAATVLPIGTAYAVWVGIGAAGAATVGMLVLGEGVSPSKVFFLFLLLVSIVGLKLSSPS